jgi:hypothetical protein
MCCLLRGYVIGWYDVRSHHLVTFERTLEHGSFTMLAEALGSLVKDGRCKTVEVRKINGQPYDASSTEVREVVALLEQHHFVRGYRGLALRS